MKPPQLFFLELRPEVWEKIIENIEAIQTDIRILEAIVEKKVQT